MAPAANKLGIRTSHFPRLTITFGLTQSTRGPTLDLAGVGQDAIPQQTPEGPRAFNLVLNSNTGHIHITESRGNNGSNISRSVILLHQQYKILVNRKLEGDVWEMVIKSTSPLRVDTDIKNQGELMKMAIKQGNQQQIDWLKRRMTAVLLLGSAEACLTNVNCRFVRVTVPDCNNSGKVSMELFAETFSKLDVKQPQLSIPDYIAEIKMELKVERTLDDGEQLKLARPNVTCRFFAP